MRPPLSKRLAACAALVPRGAVAADVGTDHGYLSIYLVQQGICPRVIASDLRQKPLEKARENVLRYGASEQITLLLSDGLKNFRPGSFDTLICAGMGGDCICAILQAAPWLKDGRYTLILQPQSSGNDLRRWLGQNGFSIERETLVQDGRFLYGVMAVRYGAGRELTPGEQYVSDALLRSGDENLPRYLERVQRALARAVSGIRKGESAEDREKLEYYETAYRQVCEMREKYDHL